MKIGYFITHYPYKKEYDDYFCGGTGAVAINLAKEMVKKGHDVSVFTTSRTKKFEFEVNDGIKIYRYEANFRIAEAYMSFRLLFQPLKYELDMIHAHMGNAPAPITAWIYSKLKNKPLIITYHGDQQDSYGNLLRRCSVKLYNKLFAKNILKSADAMISPSEPFLNESKFLPTFKKKVTIIPNGINRNEVLVDKTKDECRKELSIPTNDIMFLFLGSLSKYKGPDVLMKSFNIVKKEMPNTTLAFVGGGQMKNELELFVKKMNLHDCVKFAGFVDNKTKLEYLKAADVFVLPSTLNTEVFPIVLLEASAAKLPMVVSDLETFNCIIKDGINGIITKRNDHNYLANALISLASKKSMRDEMSDNAYKISEDFSWEDISHKTEMLYDGVL